ncbi:MAG: DUF3352 domain-containing protein [Anaerolineae bacterium]
MQEPQPLNESSEFEVKPQLPRPRGRTIGLAAVGIGALVVAGVIAGALINRAAAPQDDPLARVMPSNTIAYFSMTTHPDLQPNFNVIADAWKNSKEAGQIESGLSAALTAAGFDWEKDVLPWLGDRVAVGVVDLGGSDPPADSSGAGLGNYRPPFFVVAVHTRDRAKSDAFLAEFRAQRESSLGSGGSIEDDLYRNIPIVYVTNDSEYSPGGEAYATVNDVIVLTIGPDNLKKVIDAALDGTNLGASDNFNATLNALPNPNVGAAYLDFARYSEALATMQAGMVSSFDTLDDSELAKQMREQQQEQLEQMRQMMQAFGGMGAAMTYEPGGIRFDAAMQIDFDRAPEAWRDLYNFDLPAPSNRIFDAIPSSAVMAMNTSNPAASWKALLNNPDWLALAFGGFYGGKDVSSQIAQLEQTVGIDLEADLLDLLNGELAFVVLPKPDQPAPETDDPFSSYPRLPFEIAVLFDSSDPARASSSLDKLMNALVSLGGHASLQPLDSLPATALADEDGGVVLTYGVVDGRLVIGSNPDTLRAIDAAGQSPLSADEAFKAAVSALPANRLSTGYARLESLWNWLGSSFAGALEQECGPCNYLRPIQWLSFSSEPPDKASGLIRSTMHVALEPVR